MLKHAGIERADGLAAVTSSDETNVVTTQVAGQIFHVPRVVACLYNRQLAELYERLGLQTTAPTTWGVNRIADLLCYSRLDPVFSIGKSPSDIGSGRPGHPPVEFAANAHSGDHYTQR